MKAQLCRAFFLLITATSLCGQAVPSADRITGIWKLNLDKSKDAQPLPESEIITIASQHASYELTFGIKQSNGYNPKYDVVTDMKGEPVKPINADGRGTNDIWRVKRHDENAFDMRLNNRFGEWMDKYEVSADGKTMTLHRVPSPNNMVIEGPGGAIPSHEAQSDLVFNRVE